MRTVPRANRSTPTAPCWSCARGGARSSSTKTSTKTRDESLHSRRSCSSSVCRPSTRARARRRTASDRIARDSPPRSSLGSEERVQGLGIALQQLAYRCPTRLAHVGKLPPFEQAGALDVWRDHEVGVSAGCKNRVSTAYSECPQHR